MQFSFPAALAIPSWAPHKGLPLPEIKPQYSRSTMGLAVRKSMPYANSLLAIAIEEPRSSRSKSSRQST